MGSHILILDPGWVNLGILLICFDDSKREFRKFFGNLDLSPIEKGDERNHPEQFVSRMEATIYEFLRGHCALSEMAIMDLDFEYLVIEKQPEKFRQNVHLQIALTTWFATRFVVDKTIILNPLLVKGKLGLKCKGNHDAHKNDMVERIKQEDMLFHGDYNNNIADCVGILNVFCLNHKRVHKRLITYKDISSP